MAHSFVNQTIVIPKIYYLKRDFQTNMVIFWKNQSFYYHGNYTKKENRMKTIQSFQSLFLFLNFLILSTFTSKHKYLKKQKHGKLYSGGWVTS